MQGNNNESFNTDAGAGDNAMANKGKGSQGIDKAPGEETAQSTGNIVSETQKGKKVDADPSQSSGQPAKEE